MSHLSPHPQSRCRLRFARSQHQRGAYGHKRDGDDESDVAHWSALKVVQREGDQRGQRSATEPEDHVHADGEDQADAHGAAVEEAQAPVVDRHQDEQGRADPEQGDEGHGLRRLRVVGGGGLHAKHFPRNIRAQFFAPHLRAARTRLSFDDGAALGRHLTVAAEPFADGGLFHPEGGGHGGLAPEALDGAFDGCHEEQYRHYRCLPQAHCLLKAMPVAISSMETLPMHTGAALGAALKEAMQAKAVTQQNVADAFGVKQSSVSEWIRFGRVHKKHLTKLIDYFSDVVGPEHWGLPPSWGQQTQQTPYSEQLTLSPLERDLVLALRKLPDEEQTETVHDVMHRAEVFEKVVKRELARRGIDITGYVSASRAAETLPAPPAPPAAHGDPHVMESPLTHNKQVWPKSRERKS